MKIEGSKQITETIDIDAVKFVKALYEEYISRSNRGDYIDEDGNWVTEVHARLQLEEIGRPATPHEQKTMDALHHLRGTFQGWEKRS